MSASDGFTGCLIEDGIHLSIDQIAKSIKAWRQVCHDTHECWKPLAERRNRRVAYCKPTYAAAGDGELIREDWYKYGRNISASAPPIQLVELPPIEPENARLDNVPLPSRCLEIVPHAESGKCRFWLRETGGQMGKYIILSHRWVPDTERVRTLRDNYETRVGHSLGPDDAPPIAPGDVTPLFQEASQVAARLDINYIWIDSLCIIQDDADDWKRESVKMASYYQNAWLTFAGTAINPHTEGLLFQSVDPDIFPPIIHLPYTDKSRQRRGSFCLQPIQNPQLRHIYNQKITKSELLGRGWVFQEWLLGTRTVAFTSAGVFFICSESSPESVIGGKVPDETQGVPDKSYKSALDLNLLSRSDTFESWRRVVESYSALSFTKLENDRLVALSGVAEEFCKAQRNLGPDGVEESPMAVGDYLSGLWRNDMGRGLQWEVVDKSVPLVRLNGLPTWSWASLGQRATVASGRVVVQGVSARWHTQWPQTPGTWFEVVDVVSIPVSRSFETQFDDGQSSTTLNDDFGVDNRFLALKISGELTNSFRLDTAWASRQEMDDVAENTAAWLTGGDKDKEICTSSTWHRVCAANGKGKPLGWASFDDPELRLENSGSGPCTRDGRPVHAFRLCKWYDVRVGPWYSDKKVNIFAVLFVAAVDRGPKYTPCFERLGVGRMVQAGFLEKFKLERPKLQTFWLV